MNNRIQEIYKNYTEIYNKYVSRGNILYTFIFLNFN